MKNYKIYTFLILMVIGWSCEKEYEQPFSFSDVEWVVSETAVENLFQIAQEDYISFVDLSKGALSHKWTIDQGCYFLRPDFTKEDSVYTDFIVPNAGNISNDARAHVLFRESGIKTINLYNTYSDSVAFFTKDEVLLQSVKKGDQWVIDTTFMVDVYATIEPAFKVFFGEELVLEVAADEMPDDAEQDSWKTVTVEVGQQLTFVDMTTIGRPNRRTWDIAGGSPISSNDSASVISFFTMGTATGSSVTVSRGSGLPAGATTKIVPLKVEVVQSSQPFEITGKAKELENGNIGFNVTGEVTPFNNEEANFTVHVVNTTAGFDQNILVTKAEVSDDDATMIELTLAEPVYNTDEINISYAGGVIQSLDLRDLQEFSDVNTTMIIGGSVTNTDKMGFEIASANFKKGFADGFWVGNQNPIVFARSEDVAASGTASMSCTFDGAGTTFKIQASSFIANGAVAPAGPYIEKIKVYVDENTTLKAFKTYMTAPVYANTWDISEIEKGQWVTLSKVVNIDEQPTKNYGIKILAADNPDVSGTQLIYFDDMQLIPLEARP